MKARFNADGTPHADYRHAHVIDASGRLATIASVYLCEGAFHVHRGRYVAKLRRFNGEDAGEQMLATLDILDRTLTEEEVRQRAWEARWDAAVREQNAIRKAKGKP